MNEHLKMEDKKFLFSQKKDGYFNMSNDRSNLRRA